MTATPQPERVPWHFWIAVVAAAGYLLLRLGQGVVWLLQRVF